MELNKIKEEENKIIGIICGLIVAYSMGFLTILAIQSFA